MKSIKKIKINPKDFSKISHELILNITLKDGTILISDDAMPLQDINNLINNEKDNIAYNQYQNCATYFNYNTNNSYERNNVKTLEANNSCSYKFYIKKELNKENLSNGNYFYDRNKYLDNNIEENKNYEYKNKERPDYNSQNQSISDIVNEKFHKKFKNNLKEKKLPIEATINSEIKINIKGKDSKNGLNSLLKDFNELLSNFNYKKRGIQNNSKDKNKYKYYKRNSIIKKDKLLLENLSGISPNEKAIKYIGRNENNITELNDKNLLGLNFTKNKVSYLKENKNLKRNKSNHLYFLKDNRFSNIISPPKYLHYNKMKFI